MGCTVNVEIKAKNEGGAIVAGSHDGGRAPDVTSERRKLRACASIHDDQSVGLRSSVRPHYVHSPSSR